MSNLSQKLNQLGLTFDQVYQYTNIDKAALQGIIDGKYQFSRPAAELFHGLAGMTTDEWLKNNIPHPAKKKIQNKLDQSYRDMALQSIIIDRRALPERIYSGIIALRRAYKIYIPCTAKDCEEKLVYNGACMKHRRRGRNSY